MKEGLFGDIVKKIRRDTPSTNEVSLFNWTEPAIHPRLPNLIKIAREHGLRCELSTNLNIFLNMEDVIAAEPRTIVISLSGFTQEFYQRTHSKGDVEVVKANMRKLRETIDRVGADTQVNVVYHLYRDNCGEELRNMQALAYELQFNFLPLWAHLTSVEKHLQYCQKGVDTNDQEIVDLLAVKPEEYREIALRDPSPDCVLRSEQTAINVDGSVALCCAVYDAERFKLAESFLDHTHEELQAMKYAHPYCGPCMAHGYHDIAKYKSRDKWSAIAAHRIAPDRVPEFDKKKFRRPHKLWRMRRRVMGT